MKAVPAAAALALLLCACGSGTGPSLPAGALPVPIVRQSAPHTCGPAALLAVLLYWQVYEGNESGLLRLTGATPAEGTTPQGIVRGALRHGLKAEYREKVTADELRAALGRGETVILDVQAWPTAGDGLSWARRREDGHYLVLVALDGKYAYFMDPSVGTGYTYIPLAELPERWHDYENLETGVWENEGLAIFISGKTPLKKYPAAPVPTL